MAVLARWALSISVCVLALVASAGCGGGEYRLAPASNESLPTDPTWDGAQLIKGVQVAAREQDMRTLSPVTEQLELKVEGAGDAFSLGIAAPETEQEYLLLQVRYDAERWHVKNAELAAVVTEQCLMFGVSETPGLYSLCVTGIHGAKLPDVDEALTLIHFESGPERNVSAAEPMCATTPVDDLRINAEAPDTLVWSFRSTGDYDQNGEANVADLVPIGAYYLEVEGGSRWAYAKVADGDENGEVNTSDLVPIGMNLLRSIHGYAVYEGLSESGPWIDTDQRVLLANSAVPQGEGYKRFTHKIAGVTQERWYMVRAYYNETIGGGQSNSVQYGVADELRPPRFLSARFDGEAILLEWQAPSGSSPDAYRVYASFTSSFDLPWLLERVEPDPVLQFSVSDAFEPTDQFYFAVTAIYGSQASPYSNIYHYDGSWEKVPPVWTGGAPDGGINTAEIYEDYAFITWFSAIDLISKPVHYNLYWAPSSEGIDWSEPQYVTRGTTRVIAPLTAGVSYDFAVRAVDAVGNVTTNTNYLTRVYEGP